MESKRIEYIDLMKGICIVLIILLHCGITFQNERLDNMFRDFRIPLYFFLSGLFFKEYGGFTDFCIRKINKLILPYIFFAYIPYALIDFTLPYKHTIISYILMLVEPYNGPLWFLRCLFFTYMLYYLFYKCVINCKWIVQMIILILITFFVWSIIPDLPSPNSKCMLIIFSTFQNIIMAIMAIPFFFVAYSLRKKGFLNQQIKKTFIVTLFVFFLVVWFLTYQKNINHKLILLGTNYLFLYTSALGGIGCVWCIAYVVKHLFYFSYVGRYSLIALGTHYPFVFLFHSLGVENRYLTALCVLAVMPGVIWVFKKYFPYFTAQKDLLVYDNGSVKWAWTKRL